MIEITPQEYKDMMRIRMSRVLREMCKLPVADPEIIRKVLEKKKYPVDAIFFKIERIDSSPDMRGLTAGQLLGRLAFPKEKREALPIVERPIQTLVGFTEEVFDNTVLQHVTDEEMVGERHPRFKRGFISIMQVLFALSGHDKVYIYDSEREYRTELKRLRDEEDRLEVLEKLC